MDDHDTLLQADAERYRAMREGDVDCLKLLLTDDLTYTHSSGLCDGKREYLRAIADGRFHYLDIETDDVGIRVYGDTALMSGRARFHAMVNGVERRLDNRFLSVWVREDSQWRMAAWASSPLAS